MRKVIAVIPCYNEQRYIRQVVIETLLSCFCVVVSDDASTDATIAEALGSGALVCQ